VVAGPACVEAGGLWSPATCLLPFSVPVEAADQHSCVRSRLVWSPPGGAGLCIGPADAAATVLVGGGTAVSVLTNVSATACVAADRLCAPPIACVDPVMGFLERLPPIASHCGPMGCDGLTWGALEADCLSTGAEWSPSRCDVVRVRVVLPRAGRYGLNVEIDHVPLAGSPFPFAVKGVSKPLRCRETPGDCQAGSISMVDQAKQAMVNFDIDLVDGSDLVEVHAQSWAPVEGGGGYTGSVAASVFAPEGLPEGNLAGCATRPGTAEEEAAAATACAVNAATSSSWMRCGCCSTAAPTRAWRKASRGRQMLFAKVTCVCDIDTCPL
jgi:hypothetical protein